MSSPAQIVIAYDFSDTAELALQQALSLMAEPVEREYHFLVVLDRNKGLGLKNDEAITYEYAEEVQGIAKERITKAIDNLKLGGSVELFVHVRIGDPAGQVLVLAEEVGAKLIIVGSHGRTGIKRLVLGSVSEEIVRRAACPVFVARDWTYKEQPRLKMEEVEGDGTTYVQPHRYRYDTGMPRHDKTWALY